MFSFFKPRAISNIEIKLSTLWFSDFIYQAKIRLMNIQQIELNYKKFLDNEKYKKENIQLYNSSLYFDEEFEYGSILNEEYSIDDNSSEKNLYPYSDFVKKEILKIENNLSIDLCQLEKNCQSIRLELHIDQTLITDKGTGLILKYMALSDDLPSLKEFNNVKIDMQEILSDINQLSFTKTNKYQTKRKRNCEEQMESLQIDSLETFMNIQANEVASEVVPVKRMKWSVLIPPSIRCIQYQIFLAEALLKKSSILSIPNGLPVYQITSIVLYNIIKMNKSGTIFWICPNEKQLRVAFNYHFSSLKSYTKIRLIDLEDISTGNV